MIEGSSEVHLNKSTFVDSRSVTWCSLVSGRYGALLQTVDKH